MRTFGFKDLFDPKGRVNRVGFFTGGALLSIATVSLGFAFNTLIGMLEHGIAEPVNFALRLIVFVPLVYGQFCVTAKRLHDLNLPAAPAVIGFVELTFTLYVGLGGDTLVPAAVSAHVSLIDDILMGVVVVFNLLLLFIPGTRGDNRYGLPFTGGERLKAHLLDS